MSDLLEQKLSNATEAEAEILLDRFDPEAHMDPQALKRIDVRLHKAILEESASQKPRALRFPWKKALIAVAAAAAVYLALGFTVPPSGLSDRRVFLHPARTAAGSGGGSRSVGR